MFIVIVIVLASEMKSMVYYICIYVFMYCVHVWLVHRGKLLLPLLLLACAGNGNDIKKTN